MGQAITLKKNPKIALILSVGMPGLGQIYLGQGELGAFLYLVPNLVVVLCFLFTSVKGILASLVFLFFMYMYSCMRAYFDARFGPKLRPEKSYNHPMIYIMFWSMHLAFTVWLTDPTAYLGRQVVIRAFKAKASAMEPAIVPGDLFFSQRRPFDVLALVPGDIVVVQVPGPSATFDVRRIIGCPGDVIDLQADQLTRNGETLLKSPLTQTGSGPWLFREQNQDCGYIVSQEPHPPDVAASHAAPARSPTPKQDDASRKWAIPEAHYFVLADQRSGFEDSRSWGPLHSSAIVGKVAFIIWPKKSFWRFGSVSYNVAPEN